MCTACEKEFLRYQEMQAYYDESCQLSVATADSVASFTDKVKAFVAQYPAAQEDPLYSKIRENVQQCWVSITMTIDANTEWDGVTYYDFDGNLIIPTDGDILTGNANEAASRNICIFQYNH